MNILGSVTGESVVVVEMVITVVVVVVVVVVGGSIWNWKYYTNEIGPSNIIGNNGIPKK